MTTDSNNASPWEIGRTYLVDYLLILYRRRWLALAVFAAVVVAMAAYTYRAVPVYQAQVSVLIELEQPNVVNIPEVLRQQPDNQTQFELLRSRALAQRTAAALGLWKRPELGLRNESRATDFVRSAIQIAPVRGTRVVHIRVRSTKPDLAAEIANAHARQYVEHNLDLRFRASKEATDWLESQLGEERKRVAAADAALQAFRERHDAVALAEGQNIVVQKLNELSTAVTRAKTARIDAETRYRELEALGDNRAGLDAFPLVLNNSFIQQLKTTLVTLQREYAQQAERYGELHPTLKTTRTALEETEAKLSAETRRVADSVRAAYRVALADEKNLTAALDAQKAEAMALNRKDIEYMALEREAQSLRLVYQTILQRAKETGVSRELRATNIQVIDPAQRPTVPVYPRKTYNMMLSVVLGTLLALGTVFVVEVADGRIKTPDDLRRLIEVPFFGLIPDVRMVGARRSIATKGAPSSFVESFRALRTSVQSAETTDGPMSIVVASASPGDGKTLVATNLATALAQAQQRVLLIDADLRRPKAHERFGLPLEPGLSNVLAGSATLPDVLVSTRIPGLTVLSAGTPSMHAPELLGSTGFHELFAILREHFEWIVIDSPPAITVTDVSVVARHATGVLFVVGSGKTGGRTARAAVEELQRNGGRILGTVLNRADLQRDPYYFEPYGRGDYEPIADSPLAERRVAGLQS